MEARSAKSARGSVRPAARAGNGALPLLLLFAACGCSGGMTLLAAGIVDASNTWDGSGYGTTFAVGSGEWGECAISRGGVLQFDVIEYEDCELSRLTYLYGFWFTGPPPLFFKMMVGGTAHSTDSGDRGYGPAAEVSFGLTTPIRDVSLSVELFAKGYVWLGSQDDSFESGAGGAVGVRLVVLGMGF